jgi:phage shock protein A
MPDDPTPPPTESPESSAAQPDVDPGYDKSGVPTFESVREKIETRYGTAIGGAELTAETPEGRTVEEQYEERQRAAAERLAQIRESMNSDKDDA